MITEQQKVKELEKENAMLREALLEIYHQHQIWSESDAWDVNDAKASEMAWNLLYGEGKPKQSK